MANISIIIPCLNEAAEVVASLQALQGLREQGVELILVDGGSSDNTVCLAKHWVDQVLNSPAGRARQMNTGAKQARGQLLLFLHVDCRLPEDAYQLLTKQLNSGLCWGRFDVRLDGAQAIFRVIETLMNWRSRISQIMTGDQAIFVSKTLFERVGGFADIALMEDIALSQQLKKQQAAVCLKSKVVSSSRRWQQHGIIRTVLLMWQLRLAYFFNAKPSVLAKKYRDSRG